MSDDRVTRQGTVKGHHAKPGDEVAEGGPAEQPTEPGGAMKPAASKARAQGVPEDDSSAATAGAAEKAHAADVGAGKTQSGRGHRKD